MKKKNVDTGIEIYIHEEWSWSKLAGQLLGGQEFDPARGQGYLSGERDGDECASISPRRDEEGTTRKPRRDLMRTPKFRSIIAAQIAGIETERTGGAKKNGKGASYQNISCHRRQQCKIGMV